MPHEKWNYCQACVNSGNLVIVLSVEVVFAWPYEFPPHTHADWHSAKDSQGLPRRFLELFLCMTPSLQLFPLRAALDSLTLHLCLLNSARFQGSVSIPQSCTEVQKVPPGRKPCQSVVGPTSPVFRFSGRTVLHCSWYHF